MRPSKYSEGMLLTTAEYIVSEEVVIPSIAGLARRLKVARSTIYKWAEEHGEFSDILEDLLAEQEERLVTNGLTGGFNSTITKLILTKHGYSDKVDTTLSGGEKPVEVIEIVSP